MEHRVEKFDILKITEMKNKICSTKKYHVFAPMGRFQLESIYLYFPPSSQAGTTVENKGKFIAVDNHQLA